MAGKVAPSPSPGVAAATNATANDDPIVKKTENGRLQLRTKSELGALSGLNSHHMETIDMATVSGVYDSLDVNSDGGLTVEDFTSSSKSAGVKGFVQLTRSHTLRNLTNTNDASTVRRVLGQIDDNLDGVISRDEWTEFLEAMARERVRFLKVKALMRRQCYWGLGVEEPTDARIERRVANVLLLLSWILRTRWPAGYVADFSYYVANHHNLLALFYRDADHPISNSEQMASFVLVQTWSIWMAVHLAVERYPLVGATVLHEYRFVKNYLLSFVFITCPALFYAELVFLLFACPCAHFEKRDRNWKLQLVEQVAEACGHLLAVPLLIVSGVFVLDTVRYVIRYHDNGLKEEWFFFDYAVGMTLTYLLWPLKILLIQFNLATGPVADLAHVATWGQLCRWRRERDTAKKHLAAAAPAPSATSPQGTRPLRGAGSWRLRMLVPSSPSMMHASTSARATTPPQSPPKSSSPPPTISSPHRLVVQEAAGGDGDGGHNNNIGR